MSDEKGESNAWLESYAYLHRLRYGPTPDELEVQHLVGMFNEYLTIQLFALVLERMDQESRQTFVERVRYNWKQSMRSHVNNSVKRHEAILAESPDEHLRTFIGDGESMRISANKTLSEAYKHIESLLDNVVEQINKQQG